MLQARAYALEIGVVLERDPALRQPEGSRHAGKLIMPWGWGVVLANITRKQFDEGALGEVVPEHLVICRDELYETVETEAFQERLWAMFPQVYPVALTLPQIDRVRWHLFPELRVEPGSGQFSHLRMLSCVSTPCLRRKTMMQRSVRENSAHSAGVIPRPADASTRMAWLPVASWTSRYSAGVCASCVITTRSVQWARWPLLVRPRRRP